MGELCKYAAEYSQKPSNRHKKINFQTKIVKIREKFIISRKLKILQKKIKKPGAWRAGGGRGRGTSRLATRLKILIFQFQYFCTTKFKLKLKQFGHDQTFVRKQTLSTEKSEIFRGVEISSTRFFKSGPADREKIIPGNLKKFHFRQNDYYFRGICGEWCCVFVRGAHLTQKYCAILSNLNFDFCNSGNLAGRRNFGNNFLTQNLNSAENCDFELGAVARQMATNYSNCSNMVSDLARVLIFAIWGARSTSLRHQFRICDFFNIVIFKIFSVFLWRNFWAMRAGGVDDARAFFFPVRIILPQIFFVNFVISTFG